jgi:hydroxymethylpyrimidine/phosphomethylpyrimidine kinase
VQADLKTFLAHGVYGMAAVTALTVQRPAGVSEVHPVAARLVGAQVRAVLEAIDVDAIKIGMLANAQIVEAVADALDQVAAMPIVLDPVLRSSSGAELLDTPGLEALRRRLVPRAQVLTPNWEEAAALSGLDVGSTEEAREAARRLGREVPAVLVTGGHSQSEKVEDVLVSGGIERRFRHARIVSQASHGTGCALSSAIASRLAAGLGIVQAADLAISWVARTMAPGIALSAEAAALDSNAVAGLSMRLTKLLFALLLLFASWAGAHAQQDETADQGTPPVFGETIYVKVVNVDVWVTDKKGEPITGLTVDDFELLESKKPIAISNFYELRGGAEVRSDAELAEPEKPSAPVERRREDLFTSHPGLETSDLPDERRLNLVVYIDQHNITPSGRNRLFRHLRQFLRTKVGRDDRVMLVTYNRSVKVVRPFTTDSELIAAATYELEEQTGGRTLAETERHDMLQEIDDDQDRATYSGLMARARLQAQNIYNDLQFTMDGLNEVVTQLAGVPGRKALLYVSEGLEMRAGEDLFWAISERFSSEPASGASDAIMQAFQYDGSRMFSDLADLANANRVTFYTIDAAGLRVGNLKSAEYQGTLFSTRIDSIHIRNLQDSITHLADRTGGRAIVNTNNFLDGLDGVGKDFDNHYSLGFSPSHAGNGRRYGLDVRIKKSVMKRLGIKHVRFRDSYRDKPVEQEMGDATLATLAYGFQSNPLGVRLVPIEQIARDDGNFMVSVAIRLPLDKVTLIPAGENYEGRVRLWVQAIDSQGRISPVQVNPWPLTVKAEDVVRVRSDGSYMTYELKLLMRGGDQRVAVAVRDELTAESSYVSQPVTVG